VFVTFHADGGDCTCELVESSLRGVQHFRAEIHSHTAISDGVQLPTEAMEHVAENGNVDFFGVTGHDVVFDLRNADAFTEDRYASHSDEWSYSHEAADTFNESSGRDLT